MDDTRRPTSNQNHTHVHSHSHDADCDHSHSSSISSSSSYSSTSSQYETDSGPSFVSDSESDTEPSLLTTASGHHTHRDDGRHRHDENGEMGTDEGEESGESRQTLIDRQRRLRKLIVEIQQDDGLDAFEKAKKIQQLMSSNYTKSLYTNTADPAGSSASNPALLANLQLDPSAEGFGVLRPEDRVKTWHDRDSQILGCKHYQRGAKLQARCCGKWFTCRFCHDEVSDHTLNRQQTTTMLCMHCLHPQPASQHCSACHAQLSTYYCTICKLWDDDRTKHIYHCAACGICRIGRGLGVDYFHCEKCNACMAIGLDGGNHKCIERNLECDCPICGEYMFTSTSTVIFMPCGHCIHYSCHQTYIQTSYQCPTCFKSLSDMTDYFARIDTMLQHHTMPQEYAHMTSKLYCNDCEQRSTAPYHFLYHACGECKGYNTKVLSVEKGGVLVGDGRVAAAESAGAPPGAPASNQAPAPPFLDMERQQNPPPPPPPDEAL